MNALARFETLVESLVERPFARLLRTRLQPIEVAKRLTRELEAQRTVAVNRVLVPNHYTVWLAPSDYAHFAPISMHQQDMAAYLTTYAREHKYTMPAEAVVKLERDEALRANAIRIETRMDDPSTSTSQLQPTQVMPAPPPPPTPRPQAANQRARIELEGASCFLDRDVATIGRGLDNDVVVEDRRVSRHHTRLQRGPRGWEAMDLASTNGTFVNGKQIKQGPVGNGDTISLGGLEVRFFLDDVTP